MLWTLILVVSVGTNTGGMTSQTVDFADKQGCETAREQVISTFRQSDRANAVCVFKGKQTEAKSKS